ncbi:MAG: hypothetical protein JWO08_2417 [Verrucomicrobiaceae bacterium]|nr:hypothetical protein [Verrucomicrobiaceae bacterium]
MRMLLLIPASLMAHSREVVELILGLLCLGGAALALVAGVWLRFRAVNATALVLSSVAALLFRLLSHTPKLHPAGLALCAVSIAFGVIAGWRAMGTANSPGSTGAAPSQEDGNRLRLRRRKRRPNVE